MSSQIKFQLGPPPTQIKICAEKEVSELLKLPSESLTTGE